MRLRNKKTGEIGFTAVLQSKNIVVMDENAIQLASYNSLADLIAEWEDAPEEPKEYWYISDSGRVVKGNAEEETHKQIGNYFSSREEAELAIRKLKAWKRLKEARFEFGGWTHTPLTKSLTGYNLHIKAYSDKLANYMDDLQLLFGGKE